MVGTTKLTSKFIEGFDSQGKDVTVWDESPKGFGVRFRNNRKVLACPTLRSGQPNRADHNRQTLT